MAAPTLAEQIGASFVAWEIRGRGLQIAEYPVSLEPPFRPFFLLPAGSPAVHQIDDGRRPTFLSNLAESVTTLFTKKEAVRQASPFEEAPPFPSAECGKLVTRRIVLPADLALSPEVTAQLIGAWLSSMHPISFEVIGHEGKVILQVVSAAIDARVVFSSITDYVPEASVADEGDFLYDVWDDDGASLVVDFGYADEFFLPLPAAKAFSADPFVSLVTALSCAAAGETLCYQVLLSRTMNPWRAAILDAVITPDGSSLFEDAPDFVRAVKQKTASALCACAVRFGVQADNQGRVRELLRGITPFIRQFANPGGNALVPLENDGYPDLHHTRALLTRQSFRTGMILSCDELIPLVHMPDSSVRQEAFERVVRRTKALPSCARGHAAVLGENIHRGVREEVSIGIHERLQHTVIVGATGTGKSTLLVNLIRQDMERGDGVAVLDPHGDLIDDVLRYVPKKRIPDVVLFDPSDDSFPIGFNVLRAEGELEKSVLAGDLVGMFQRLSTSWGDGMSTVLANAVLAILAHPEGGTLLHLRRFLVEDVYRKQFLAKVTDAEVQFFWTKEWPLIGARSIGPILTRLNAFLRPKVVRQIVGQRNPKLDLCAVMNGRKIFLGRLSQGLIGNENAYLLGSLLLSTFLKEALSRQRIARDERMPFYLYLDEAEHFVTRSVASLVTEARKYGVALHLAFQMLSQLKSMPDVESAVMGSAYTRIAFRVGDEDARRLDDGFSFFEADDLRSLARGEAIVRFGEARQDFNLRTFPVPAVSAEHIRERREAIVESSRAQFATQLAQVEEAIDELRDIAMPTSAPTTPPLVEVPTSPPTLSSNVVVITQRERPAPRAHPIEERPTPLLGRGGAEHKYLQHLIQRLAEEREFRSVIEEQVDGGQVDVALRRGKVSIACEVSVTTDAAHEMENIAKCAKAGFTEVWLVVADKKRKEKLASALAGSGTPARCLLPEDLVGALDAIAPESAVREKVIGGYKVKVTRKASSPEDQARRESAIAEVIARSMMKQRR